MVAPIGGAIHDKGTAMSYWSKGGWAIRLLAVVLLLLGIFFVVFGAQLAFLGGSWYYLITGVVFLVDSVLLWRASRWGAYLYGIFFVATMVWTGVESGVQIWGWVPRLALFALLALWLVFCLHHLFKIRRTVQHGLNVLIVACFVVAFVLVFVVPQDAIQSSQPAPSEPLAGHYSESQPDADWQHYGRDSSATRFSPLTQINADNVHELKQAWVFRTGDLPPKGKANKWAAENTPTKVGNGLYVCSATDNVMRLDPATGKQQWRFNSGVKYDSVPYTAACRGLTYYTSKVVPEGQMCHTRLVLATLDARLIELDTETGKPCPQFGDNGQKSVMKGIGHSVPGWLAMNDAMPVVNGTIVTNHEVLDGQARWAPSGVIRGWDAETGEFRWAWDVNRPDDHGEPPEGKTYSRGTPNSWTTMTADDKLGLVYVPTGNSAADYYSAERTANENKVSSSIVALDAKTGEQRWVFQTVHKDVWDYDMGSQPTLMDYPGPNGTTIPAMIVPTKRGQTFVLNRETGKPLSRVEEKSVPAGTGRVPGDPRALTQPWSVDMPRLGFPKLTEQKMWGMTPIDQLMCRIKFRKAYYDGEFTPPSIDKPWIEYPGYNGGSDWGSMAYNPKTGLLIANWNNTPMYDQLVTRKAADKEGLFAIDDPRFGQGGGGAEGNGAQAQTPYGIHVGVFGLDSTGLLCNQPPYGMITAINMHTKKVVWQHPLGSGEYNGPFGIPTHLPMDVGTPNNGGPIVTAGNLIFVGATTDHKIRALDARTGKQLWSATLPTGAQATPMTYSINGEQYVLIEATGHHFMRTPPGDYVIAFKLPKSAQQAQ